MAVWDSWRKYPNPTTGQHLTITRECSSGQPRRCVECRTYRRVARHEAGAFDCRLDVSGQHPAGDAISNRSPPYSNGDGVADLADIAHRWQNTVDRGARAQGGQCLSGCEEHIVGDPRCSRGNRPEADSGEDIDIVRLRDLVDRLVADYVVEGATRGTTARPLDQANTSAGVASAVLVGSDSGSTIGDDAFPIMAVITDWSNNPP